MVSRRSRKAARKARRIIKRAKRKAKRKAVVRKIVKGVKKVVRKIIPKRKAPTRVLPRAISTRGVPTRAPPTRVSGVAPPTEARVTRAPPSTVTELRKKRTSIPTVPGVVPRGYPPERRKIAERIKVPLLPAIPVIYKGEKYWRSAETGELFRRKEQAKKITEIIRERVKKKIAERIRERDKIPKKIKKRKPFTIEREIIEPLKVTTRVPIIPPKKFGIDYQKATGAKSFTIAVPVGREAGKLKVQDFHFEFKNGELIKTTPKNFIFLTDAQYVERDIRRRRKYPEFTSGKVEITPVRVPPIKKEAVALPTFKQKIKEIIIKKMEKRLEKVSKGLDIITGGLLIKRRLNYRQEQLNKEVKNFNEEFGNKELSPELFKKAQAEKDKLDKKLSALEKEQETFEESLPIGAKIVRAPFEFLGGKFEWQKKLLEKGEKQKLKEEKTKIERWLESKRGGTLPYGLAEVQELIKNPRSEKSLKIIKGEKFNPWLANYWVASKIVKIPAIDKFAKKMYKKYPKQYSIATGIAVDIGIPIFTLGQLGAFFSPAMEIGAVKKGKQVQVVKKKKPIPKKAAKKVQEALDKIRRDLVHKKAGKEQIEYLAKLSKKINKNDPEQVAQFRELVQKLYEEGTFKGFPLEFGAKPHPLTTELGKISPLTTELAKLHPPIVKPVITAIEKGVRELEGIIDIAGFVPRIEGVGATLSLGGFRETSFLKGSQLLDIKEKLEEKQKEKLITKTLTMQKGKLKTLQIPKMVQVSLQPSPKPSFKTSIKPLLRFRPKLKPLKLYLVKKSMKEKISKTLSPKLVKLFIPQAREKGKWKTLSRKSMDERAAKSRMAFAVDHSTSAQGRIIPTAKKGKKQPSKGYFNITQKKFRDYKIRKGKKIPMDNQWIEKRGVARIDTLGEKKGLKLAKLIKQQGWLKKKKKTTFIKKRKKKGKLI